MENITKMISLAFNVFMFCLAVWVLHSENTAYLHALKAASKIQKEDVIYEQHNDKDRENIVKKAEVMSVLFDSLEYDVEIDGTLISKSENVKMFLTTMKFNHKEYQKSYAYDSSGNMTRVVYQGI